MMLSQQIAKDVKYLKKQKQHVINLFDLRLKIIKARKIIVPHEMFDYYAPPKTIAGPILGDEDNPTRHFHKKLEQFSIYSRPIFPLLFIENDTGGMLIEEQSDGGFVATIIRDKGEVTPFLIECGSLANLENLHESGFPLHVHWDCKPEDRHALTQEMFETSQGVAMYDVFIILEIFLFLNVKNLTLHHYKPTKKENSAIPKPLVPQYEYYILDVFREKKEYLSLDDIKNQMIRTKMNKQERRMHVVRGHFKRMKNGLFWWSDFMRCRKNRDSIGAVTKDYRLRLNEVTTR
jgi:competence protein ComGC